MGIIFPDLYRSLINEDITLKSYQKEAIERALKNKRLLIALPTGTGKTIIALEIIKRLKELKGQIKTLIIVPANLRDNIIQNARMMGLDIDALVVKSTKDISDIEKNETIVCSYDLLRRNQTTFLSTKWDLVIVDEIHYAKSSNTKNFKYLFSLSQISEYFIGLTASFVSNKIEEFFAVISIISADINILKQAPRIIRYEVVGAKKAGFLSKLLFGKKDIAGKPVPIGIVDPKLFFELVKRYIYLPKYEKVFEDIERPEPVSKAVEMRMSEEEYTYYGYVISKIPKVLLLRLKQAIADENELRKIKMWIISAQQVLLSPDYLKLGAESKRPGTKVKVCAHIIKSNGGKKSIVFTPFVDFGVKIVNRVLNEMGIKSVEYTGELSSTQRREIERQFNEGDLQVICMTKSGSEGINLYTAEEVHLLSLVWNPEVLSQVIGRALRMTNPTKRVTIYTYLCRTPDGGETIDHWISTVVKRKRIIKDEIYKILAETTSIFSTRERL